MEHLLDIGIDNIVRLGSRSKSERLDPYLLKNLFHSSQSTKLEWEVINSLQGKLGKLAGEAEDHFNILKNARSIEALEVHLEENYPKYYDKLFNPEVDNFGFTIVRKSGKGFGAWKRSARYGPLERSTRAILATQDPWSLTPPERFAVLRQWENELVEDAIARLSRVVIQFNAINEQLSCVRKEWKKRTLERTEVIGVTTTSLAMHADLLERVQAKVLFCEEAGGM